MSSFFGIEVAPGEPAYFRPDDDCPCVRLKRAALIVRGDTVEDGTRILVKCRVAKGPPHALASLIPGRMENVKLDLTFLDDTHKTKHWPDGWTAVTADGGRSAQYEHTMVVTETGLDVLTKRTANSRPFY